MSSNYQVNKEAVEQFRKELKAMLSDVGKLDKQILNQAVNEGTAYAKRHTPVGKHPNPITFVVRNGPKSRDERSVLQSAILVLAVLKKKAGANFRQNELGQE